MDHRQFAYLLDAISWAAYAVGCAVTGRSEHFHEGIASIDSLAEEYALGNMSPAERRALATKEQPDEPN